MKFTEESRNAFVNEAVESIMKDITDVLSAHLNRLTLAVEQASKQAISDAKVDVLRKAIESERPCDSCNLRENCSWFRDDDEDFYDEDFDDEEDFDEDEDEDEVDDEDDEGSDEFVVRVDAPKLDPARLKQIEELVRSFLSDLKDAKK